MNYRRRLKDIKALVFDVDGVFSSGFWAGEGGKLYRFMIAKDGLALRYAQLQGFIVAIITGGIDIEVKQRFERLGIEDIYMGNWHKMEPFKEFCEKYNLKPEDVLYMGDDLPDYELMTSGVFAACPADAAQEIQEIADYVSEKKGGKGAVRDIIEQVMKVQQKWNVQDFFLKNKQK